MFCASFFLQLQPQPFQQKFCHPVFFIAANDGGCRCLHALICVFCGIAFVRYGKERQIIDAIAKGQDRLLLVKATGTGKTYTAFQIVYRLLQSGLKRKILYLADRNILVDQSIQQDFAPLEKVLERYGKSGHAVKLEDGHWRLTPEGFLVSNSVISDLLLVQDKVDPLSKRR